MSSSPPKKSPRKKSRALTKEEEKEIIVVYDKGGISQRDLAAKFDVSKTKVQSLLKQRKKSASKSNYSNDHSPSETNVETLSITSGSSLEDFQNIKQLSKYIESTKALNIDGKTDDDGTFSMSAQSELTTRRRLSYSEGGNTDPMVKMEQGDSRENAVGYEANSADPDGVILTNNLTWYIRRKNEERNELLREREFLLKEVEQEKKMRVDLQVQFDEKQKENDRHVEKIRLLNNELTKSKDQTALMQTQHNKRILCVQCHSESKFKFHRVPHCSDECVQKTIAKYKSC